MLDSFVIVVLQERRKSREAETKRLEEERKKDKKQSMQNKIKVNKNEFYHYQVDDEYTTI